MSETIMDERKRLLIELVRMTNNFEDAVAGQNWTFAGLVAAEMARTCRSLDLNRIQRESEAKEKIL